MIVKTHYSTMFQGPTSVGRCIVRTVDSHTQFFKKIKFKKRKSNFENYNLSQTKLTATRLS